MTCRVVCRSRLRPEATCVACIAGLRCVAAIFTSLRCRRACWCGTLMQMSRVVVLVHAGLPCWCFVAQRARRQRFIHGQFTHHWLVSMLVLFCIVVELAAMSRVVEFCATRCHVSAAEIFAPRNLQSGRFSSFCYVWPQPCLEFAAMPRCCLLVASRTSSLVLRCKCPVWTCKRTACLPCWCFIAQRAKSMQTSEKPCGAEATCITCIAVSLRCRRACWRLEPTMPVRARHFSTT